MLVVGAVATVVLTSDGSEAPSEATALKPAITGFVDRTGIPPVDFAGVVDAGVVNVAWADLEFEPGRLVVPNAIDDAIEIVGARRGLDGDGPRVALKLRVTAGIDAPEWAKRIGGDPIALPLPDGPGATIGRFWLPEHMAAYADLHRRLADRYDALEVVREVTIAGCMTRYAEPLVRGATNAATLDALVDGGLTLEADRTCQEQQLLAHRPWRLTRSSLALNPHQAVGGSGDGGTWHVDLDFTLSLMRRCREVLGARCVLANNSIRWPPVRGAYAEMYAEMAKAGPPIVFQTATPDRIGDWQRTIAWAADQGATAVELNRAYPTYDRDALAGLRPRFPEAP